jgi:hypothetical protein
MKPSSAARVQECPEGGHHVLMSDGDGYSCRYCRTPFDPFHILAAPDDVAHLWKAENDG